MRINMFYVWLWKWGFTVFPTWGGWDVISQEYPSSYRAKFYSMGDVRVFGFRLNSLELAWKNY